MTFLKEQSKITENFPTNSEVISSRLAKGKFFEINVLKNGMSLQSVALGPALPVVNERVAPEGGQGAVSSGRDEPALKVVFVAVGLCAEPLQPPAA